MSEGASHCLPFQLPYGAACRPHHLPLVYPFQLPIDAVCPFQLPHHKPLCPFQLPIDPVCLCHSVNVEVAYTESLDIKTGTGPITLGFLDTMNGSASLLSRGGSITVNGLDGSANVQSHGGPIHVRSYNTTHLTW